MKLADIKREKVSCIIHTSTQEEADALFRVVDSYDNNGTTWSTWWNIYKGKTCYRTNLGEVVAYGHIDNYIEDGEKIIEFSDLIATGGVIPTPSKPVSIADQLDSLAHAWNSWRQPQLKESEVKKMSAKFSFYTIEEYRIDKSNNTKIPTITTKVLYKDKDDCVIEGSATCDKTDYKERQGCLEALANAVSGDNFDREYNKAVKWNKKVNLFNRTCHYCGQLFDTRAEKEAHEAWHVERKKARRERYLLRKRAKEIAFEEQAQKLAKEMKEGQK